MLSNGAIVVMNGTGGAGLLPSIALLLAIIPVDTGRGADTPICCLILLDNSIVAIVSCSIECSSKVLQRKHVMSLYSGQVSGDRLVTKGGEQAERHERNYLTY
jgi:hypothetical protein